MENRAEFPLKRSKSCSAMVFPDPVSLWVRKKGGPLPGIGTRGI
jgi:hypothetical protein